jgi:hypothetical protein
MKNQRSRFVSGTRPRRLRLKTINGCRSTAFLGFKLQLLFEWRGQDGQSEAEQPDHPASLGDSNAASHSDQVFGTHSGIWAGIPRSPRTPVPGFYLASSFAGSGGFTGAISSGADAVRVAMMV